MKHCLSTLLICLVVLTLPSCKTAEQKYMDEYTHFAESFLAQCNTYSATDWEAASTRYEQLREQYAVYITDLTPEQRQTVEQYNSKLNAEFVRHEIGATTEQVKSLFKETIGTLNELLE